ncbi:MAG: alkaline phosphatase family protein [Actinobacteria bacterium]|nr:alkaline phosphatase family protein [Actinomycetota bacterium]
MMTGPSYDGRGLVNLIAAIEQGLTGRAESPLTELPITAEETVVLVLFDGLGMAQLEHPAAEALLTSVAGVLEAPFPTTTSVSLATIATGLPPSLHGQVAHLAWMEELGLVVNTLKWVDLTGAVVRYPYAELLPYPNLWERLHAAGIEPITVQPGAFVDSPLTTSLYRGTRFEGAWDAREMVVATTQLAESPGRFIFLYVPQVDYAGHVYGLGGPEFTEAIEVAVGVWEGLVRGLPKEVTLLGTADHGLSEFDEDHKLIIRDYTGLRFAGDTRGVNLWGDHGLMDRLAEETGGVLTDPTTLIGPDPSAVARSRVGELVLLPPDDIAVIPKGFDRRLRCYHGGLSRAEVEIPLLMR